VNSENNIARLMAETLPVLGVRPTGSKHGRSKTRTKCVSNPIADVLPKPEFPDRTPKTSGGNSVVDLNIDAFVVALLVRLPEIMSSLSASSDRPTLSITYNRFVSPVMPGNAIEKASTTAILLLLILDRPSCLFEIIWGDELIAPDKNYSVTRIKLRSVPTFEQSFSDHGGTRKRNIAGGCGGENSSWN
jgi:hypothetical protein